jgi:hypothetical protein
MVGDRPRGPDDDLVTRLRREVAGFEAVGVFSWAGTRLLRVAGDG